MADFEVVGRLNVHYGSPATDVPGRWLGVAQGASSGPTLFNLDTLLKRLQCVVGIVTFDVYWVFPCVKTTFTTLLHCFRNFRSLFEKKLDELLNLILLTCTIYLGLGFRFWLAADSVSISPNSGSGMDSLARVYFSRCKIELDLILNVTHCMADCTCHHGHWRNECGGVVFATLWRSMKSKILICYLIIPILILVWRINLLFRNQFVHYRFNVIIITLY